MPIQKYFGQIGVASGPNYPGYFTNLFASSITNTGPVVGNQVTLAPATVASLSVTAAQSGTTFLLSAATVSTAQVVVLPTPTPGLVYEFDVIAAATASYTYKLFTGNASVFFQGIDAKAVSATVGEVEFFQSAGTSTNYYDMNGTTLGGLIGTNVKAVCLSSSLWQLQALSIGTGTLATSFATS